jgi:hypothetical protein
MFSPKENPSRHLVLVVLRNIHAESRRATAVLQRQREPGKTRRAARVMHAVLAKVIA